MDKVNLQEKLIFQKYFLGSRTSGTRVEKQLIILRARQKQFKEAALSAKKNGNISLAKEYLRLSKCFDPLIEASLNGLPVDMSTVSNKIFFLLYSG